MHFNKRFPNVTFVKIYVKKSMVSCTFGQLLALLQNRFGYILLVFKFCILEI